jgi:hypothetical protein
MIGKIMAKYRVCLQHERTFQCTVEVSAFDKAQAHEIAYDEAYNGSGVWEETNYQSDTDFVSCEEVKEHFPLMEEQI